MHNISDCPPKREQAPACKRVKCNHTPIHPIPSTPTHTKQKTKRGSKHSFTRLYGSKRTQKKQREEASTSPTSFTRLHGSSRAPPGPCRPARGSPWSAAGPSPRAPPPRRSLSSSCRRRRRRVMMSRRRPVDGWSMYTYIHDDVFGEQMLGMVSSAFWVFWRKKNARRRMP